jgi:hypothetical protein
MEYIYIHIHIEGLEEARPRAATGMPTGMLNACNVRHAYGLPDARLRAATCIARRAGRMPTGCDRHAYGLPCQRIYSMPTGCDMHAHGLQNV